MHQNASNDEEGKSQAPLKTAAEIMAEDPTDEGEVDLDFVVRQVSVLASKAREDADKAGASAQQMLQLLKVHSSLWNLLRRLLQRQPET